MKKPKFNFTKRGVATVSQVSTVILILFLYILADYINIGGTVFLWTDPFYWLFVTINLMLIIGLMITVRAMRKQERLDSSCFINDTLSFVDRARRLTIGNDYSTKLDEYLVEVNKQNKYETYLRKIVKKLNRLEFWANLKLIRPKKADLKRKELELFLRIPKEEVIKQHIRYKEVTKTALSSGVDGKIISNNNYDISTHEKKDIAQMIGLKSLLVYIIAAIGGTFLLSFIWNGWDALYGTGLKLLSLCLALWSAFLQADNFVDYNITEAMHKRIEIWSGFINKIPDLKDKMIIAKENDDRLDAFEKLNIEPSEILELKNKMEQVKKDEK